MNPWPLLAWIVTLAAAVAGGWQLRGDHEAAKQLKIAEANASALKVKQDQVTALSADLETARAAQSGKNRVITREVARYVEITPPDRRCTLDGRWRLLHDGAATGEPADTARLVAGQADPVADAAALDTIAINYEHCRNTLAQLAGWQQWWDQVGR